MSNISAWQYFTLFTAAFGIVGFLTPQMRKIAIKRKIYDAPTSSHKTHIEPVPYLGGVAIAVGTTTIIFLALLLSNADSSQFRLSLSLLVPALALAMIGLVDDLRDLPPLPRLVAQSVAGLVTAIIVVKSNTVGNPTGSAIFDSLITIFWFVGICNSINFFDNVDGGASGAIATISFGVVLIAAVGGQVLISACATVLLGSSLGFLIWNRSPARIYMGDAGSLFLGSIISILTIRLNPQTNSQVASFAIPLFLLAIPVLDTCVAVTSRIIRGISPFQGGQDHLSHRLMNRGMPKRLAVFVLWSLSLFFVSAAIALNTFITSEIFVVAIVLIWIILLILFLALKTKETTSVP